MSDEKDREIQQLRAELAPAELERDEWLAAYELQAQAAAQLQKERDEVQ
jgi:hypothetical protein